MAVRSYNCSVEGCHSPALARHLCNRHYIRFRKFGDPLGGGAPKPPKGEPLAFLKKAFERETDECILWPYARKSSGAGCVWHEGKLRTASNIVCEWGNGPADEDRYQAAHSCGNGHLGCVNKRHLSWKTPVENAADRLLHGTDNRGIKHKMAKLTPREVGEIRGKFGKISNRKIAAQYGVSGGCIDDIMNRRTWAHL